MTDKEISIGAGEALEAYEFLITYSFTELIINEQVFIRNGYIYYKVFLI